MKIVKAKPSDPGAALRRLFLIVAAMAVGLAFHVPSACAVDIDEDGLPDDVEQALIDAHRPWLYYNTGETYWPSSVTWKVQHSELIYDTTGNVIYTIDDLNANPMLVLSGSRWDGNVLWNSSTEYAPFFSKFLINIYDEYRHGSDPADGMYARVVPLTGPIACPNYPPDLSGLVQAGDLLIQYYQFFPFNDYQDLSWPFPDETGDHEGDWLFLDVFVAGPPTYAMKAIVYHHHGDSQCNGPTLVTGSDLPTNGIPDCYLELGGHEWWPRAGTGTNCQFYYHKLGIDWGPFPNGSHDGNGPRVRPGSVLNVGEHFAPMDNNEAKMIAFFNGKWGYSPDPGMADSPPGPLALTDDRCFCVQAPRFVAYVMSGFVPPRNEVKATRYYPIGTVSEGVDIVQTNGHVRVFPGSYPEALTITKPMTLEVWNTGTVTIGQ